MKLSVLEKLLNVRSNFVCDACNDYKSKTVEISIKDKKFWFFLNCFGKRYVIAQIDNKKRIWSYFK